MRRSSRPLERSCLAINAPDLGEFVLVTALAPVGFFSHLPFANCRNCGTLDLAVRFSWSRPECHSLTPLSPIGRIPASSLPCLPHSRFLLSCCGRMPGIDSRWRATSPTFVTAELAPFRSFVSPSSPATSPSRLMRERAPRPQPGRALFVSAGPRSSMSDCASCTSSVSSRQRAVIARL
jgi:hypothetical protein